MSYFFPANRVSRELELATVSTQAGSAAGVRTRAELIFKLRVRKGLETGACEVQMLLTQW